MQQVIEIAAKAALGGALVVLFALISEVFSPKTFSGIFSAAPSVAIAGLSVTLVAKSDHEVALAGQGAFVGAVALLIYCLIAVPALRRFGAFRGAGVAMLGWLVIAVPAMWAMAT